jgi:hypothetical protein
MMGLLFLAAVLSSGNLYGAEEGRDEFLTCNRWNAYGSRSNENTSMILGWLKGTEAALALSETPVTKMRG